MSTKKTLIRGIKGSRMSHKVSVMKSVRRPTFHYTQSSNTTIRLSPETGSKVIIGIPKSDLYFSQKG